MSADLDIYLGFKSGFCVGLRVCQTGTRVPERERDIPRRYVNMYSKVFSGQTHTPTRRKTNGTTRRDKTSFVECWQETLAVRKNAIKWRAKKFVDFVAKCIRYLCIINDHSRWRMPNCFFFVSAIFPKVATTIIHSKTKKEVGSPIGVKV